MNIVVRLGKAFMVALAVHLFLTEISFIIYTINNEGGLTPCGMVNVMKDGVDSFYLNLILLLSVAVAISAAILGVHKHLFKWSILLLLFDVTFGILIPIFTFTFC